MLVPAVLLFVALAYSGPLGGRNPRLCNTGTAQCCTSMQSANSPGASLVGVLIGAIPLDGGLIGLSCTSLTGAGSTVKCDSNPVCCNETHYNGLINVGCSSMDL